MLAARFREANPKPSREEISRTIIFHEVELSALLGLLDRMPCVELAPGDVLIHPGAANRTLCVVLSGSLTVHVSETESEPIAVVASGESVGELGLIDDSPPSAYVICREQARILMIPADTFWAIVQSSHEFTVNLLTLLARRLRGNNATVKESKRLQAEYKRHASVDGLTGLANRRRLSEVLPRYLARGAPEQAPLSLLMCDVDFFKRYNDEYGHHAGDLVLFEVGRTLRDRCRPTDFAARYGGEEFTVVLPNTRKGDALLVADRLRLAIAELTPQLESGTELPRITISIGLSEARSGDTPETLVERADRALYEAKRSGRNRVCLETP